MSCVPTIRACNSRFSELGYATRCAADAIVQFHNNLRRLQAEADFRPHWDTMITAVAFNSDSVRFDFDDQSALSMMLRQGHLSWSVFKAADGIAIRTDSLPRTANLTINDHGPWLWDRAKLLKSRVGKRASFLSAGVVNLYFYCHDCHIIRFGPLMNADTGIDFLFWGETN